ncbi:TPA: hypothetical protein N2F43_004730, partial [Salmonella enterica]|nr:hypothetical protein [Salmonella enterica]
LHAAVVHQPVPVIVVVMVYVAAAVAYLTFILFRQPRARRGGKNTPCLR